MASTNLNPYLNFRGTAHEALAFYASVFGGEPNVMSFADAGMGPEMGIPEDELHLTMHGQLEAPNGFVLMAADVPSRMELSEGSSVSVSLSGDGADELTGYWEKLSDGATITAPLNKAPWGDTFGMCTDKFGVNWLVNIAGSAQS